MTLTRKLALLLAGAMTAFALVTAGALLSYSVAPQAEAQTQQPAASTTAGTTSAGEDAYRQQQTEGGQAQAQAPAAADNTPMTTPAYAVSPDQATALALNAAPGAFLVTAPRLVSLDGAAAYEVGLDQGNVYIDANTGVVLYSGTSTAAASDPGAAGGQAFGDDHEGFEGHDRYSGYDDHEEYGHGDD
jgi:uncharacterized membrane protein YkoI